MKKFTLLVLLFFFALGAKANPDNPPKAGDEPDFEVKAYYYPDSQYQQSAYVRVLWGSSFYDFESQTQDPFYGSGWVNDTIYPWTVTQPQIPGYHGSLCLMSGNSGIEDSSSSIELSVYFVQDGSISFLGGCYGEGENYDACEFYIDGALQFSYGELQSWDTYSFNVSAGTHVFTWSYTKDSSLNALGDAFFVDDITFTGVSRLGESNSSYNVYLQPFDAATGGGLDNPILIATNVTGNQFIVENWAELEAGYYQFGIENPELTSTEIFWSNALNKSTVDYFTVTVTAYPAYAGTVTGGGTFAYGEMCTLKATPNDRYSFSHWSDTLMGHMPECTFSVTEDVNIQAIFEGFLIEYYYWAEPEEGGEVEIVGAEEGEEEWVPIHYGDTVTFKATPNDGYSFVKWTAQGSIGYKGGHTRSVEFLSDSTTCTVIFNDDFLDRIFDDVIFDDDTIEAGGDGSVIEFVATFEEGIDGCLRPKQFTNTEVGPDFATFSWVEGGSAESWYIYYHDATPTPTAPEDLYVEVTENPYTLWGLDPETPYEAYVVSACGVVDGVPNSLVSSETISFTTMEPCPTPLHVEVDSITGCTAMVKWMDYSDSYRVEAGLPNILLDENFDNGIPSDWSNDTRYPWDTISSATGGFCMISGNQGIDNTSSSISITMSFDSGGVVEFDAECRGEGDNYDVCTFSIDNEVRFSYGQYKEGWNHYSYDDVQSGEHTFTWTYSKDYSLSAEGDYFAVANLFMREKEIEWSNPLTVEDAQCTITGLTPLTSYLVHVQGICENEETEWSNPINFTTTDVCIIKASVNPTGAGTVTGAGEYSLGDTCTLVASANTGYIFDNWTKNDTVVSYDATHAFIVSRDAEYVANFSQIEYYFNLLTSPREGGYAEFLNDSTYVFHYGDAVSIHAIPNQGYSFVNWTMWNNNDEMELSTNSTYNFTIGDDNPVTNLYPEGGQISLTANFEMRNLEITVLTNPVDAGTVLVGDTIFTGGTFAYGETLTMSAVDNTGYTFQEWTKNDTVVSTSRTLTVTVTETAEYVANFQLNNYEISTSVVPTDGGEVTGAGFYDHGTTATLTATPNTGYTFVNWTEESDVVSTSSTYSFTVIGTRTLVAHFQLNSYAITATADPTNGGAIYVADTIFTGGTFDHGTQITMVAEAVTGYVFQNWTKNGSEASTSTNISITVTEAADYVAHFVLNSFDITAMISVNPTDGGTVEGAGTFNYGETCNLTAIPATGFHFVKWTKNGEQVSTDPAYSFTVLEAATYVAYFELDSFDVTAMV